MKTSEELGAERAGDRGPVLSRLGRLEGCLYRVSGGLYVYDGHYGECRLVVSSTLASSAALSCRVMPCLFEETAAG
jgi:hypothetical protein